MNSHGTTPTKTRIIPSGSLMVLFAVNCSPTSRHMQPPIYLLSLQIFTILCMGVIYCVLFSVWLLLECFWDLTMLLGISFVCCFIAEYYSIKWLYHHLFIHPHVVNYYTWLLLFIWTNVFNSRNGINGQMVTICLAVWWHVKLFP